MNYDSGFLLALALVGFIVSTGLGLVLGFMALVYKDRRRNRRARRLGVGR